ncbi:uncharacterized protein LOC113278824 [Papaver somniferum]|uniref:uncharacterized protein LOC113278824 n=1 Tax=Papaver somniferum TaxID=3469 RepID=UPI000E6F98EE|nr:uncharacterized protein LOC113278824 [Papaver somniferum]
MSSNLTKTDFAPLDISGNNYISWVLEAELHLQAKNLVHTIKAGNAASQQDRALALIFLRHHIQDGLISEYLTVKDPEVMWSCLKDRYDHLKMVILLKVKNDWLNLRLQDFKSVSEYNSALFRITSQLKFCGENITDEQLLEKTFTTFHTSSVVLQQQYQERRFKKYSELISCLLVAEQNNELLLRNHESRPVGSVYVPEAHATTNSTNGNGRGNNKGKGKRGRGNKNNQDKNSRFKPNHQEWKDGTSKKEQKPDKGKDSSDKPIKNKKDVCYHCGMTGYWSRTCRTAKHLVNLYQAYMKRPAVDIETNLIETNEAFTSSPHLDFDFLTKSEEGKWDISDFLNKSDDQELN